MFGWRHIELLMSFINKLIEHFSKSLLSKFNLFNNFLVYIYLTSRWITDVIYELIDNSLDLSKQKTHFW